MQAVHVLSNEREALNGTASVCESVVGAIRAGRGDVPAAPIVPLPDERRIPPECLGNREFLRAEISPKPFGSTKPGNATGRGDPRTRQHRDLAMGTQPRGEAGDAGVPCVGHDPFYVAGSLTESVQ